METRPRYSDISPLLVERHADKEQGTVRCLFACPVTGRRVTAESHIRQGNSLKDRMLDSASRSFWYELRYAVANKISSLLPHGFVRDVVQGTAWRMAYSGDDHVNSGDELDQATVDAFLTVRDQFQHDGQGWRAREVVHEFVTDFERQLRKAPIGTRYEGEILARVLSHMASVDGIEGEERDFLARYGGAGTEQGGPPSRVELSELRPEARPTVYLLAATLTLVDRHQSREEVDYLKLLEQELEIEGSRAAELRRAAGEFLVEQSLDTNSRPSPDHLRELANLAGLTPDDVERVLVRRRKRSL